MGQRPFELRHNIPQKIQSIQYNIGYKKLNNFYVVDKAQVMQQLQTGVAEIKLGFVLTSQENGAKNSEIKYGFLLG